MFIEKEKNNFWLEKDFALPICFWEKLNIKKKVNCNVDIDASNNFRVPFLYPFPQFFIATGLPKTIQTSTAQQNQVPQPPI